MSRKKNLLPVFREYIIQFLKRFDFTKNMNIRHRKKRGEIIPVSEMDDFLNVANEVLFSDAKSEIRVGLVKDDEFDAEGYFSRRAYWPKYERFLKNNQINYSFYDIHTSQWQNEAKAYDVIIWHPLSSPEFQAEAESKIYFLEKFLNIHCYPTYDEIWSYEDKVRAYYLYSHFRIPVVPAFVSNSRTEAIEFINQTSFPVISKLTNGSASFGVSKIKNKRSAFSYINLCFSKVGRATYWPFVRQINYVYFQKFINTAKFDLRIIVVGKRLFGYYRYPNEGDFRASGAGKVKKEALPEEAMRIAVRTKEILKSTSLAVDMIYSEEDMKYLIIETSVFFGIDTAEQLVINGKPGYYEYNGENFTFKEGRFWVQELVLQDYFSKNIK